MAVKVLDVDLVAGPRDFAGLAGYRQALVLLRWRGRPLGQVEVDVLDGRVHGLDLWRAASHALGLRLAAAALEETLPLPPPRPAATGPLPAASVVVCTRDRADDLRRCLDALCAAARGEVEIIVVDNAPSDNRTRQVAAEHAGLVRYVLEPRPGLNWARTRGAAVARGEVVLFTDDDVVVDRDWIDALRRPFVDPQVGAATGLVLPLELETPAQVWFERHYPFGRGYERRELSLRNLAPAAAGNAGAGASMAFRRRLIEQLGLFAAELDGGTPARSGGDTYAFYRLLAAGGRLVYTPEALAWHRHRRSLGELEAAVRGYSVGACVVLLRCLLEHGETGALYGLWWWLRSYIGGHARRGLGAGEEARTWRRLALAELRGCLEAPRAYWACRERERAGTARVITLPGAEISTASGA